MVISKQIKGLIKKIAIFFVLTFNLILANSVCAEMKIERYSLTVPNYKINSDEKVVEFKVSIQQGFVVSVPKLPHGWFMKIDLPEQSTSVVSAGSSIGVADLTSEETKFFNDFLLIEVVEGQNPPLKIDMEIVTSDGSSKVKHSTFKMKDLLLKKQKIIGK